MTKELVNAKYILTKSFKILLGLGVAFFKALVDVAWGIAGLLLLMGLLVQYKFNINETVTITMGKLMVYTVQHMKAFFGLFLLYYGYIYVSNLLKEEPRQ